MRKEKLIMDESMREQIAVWRYGIIAPTLDLSRRERIRYFRQLETSYLEVPHKGRRRYRVSTLLSWVRRYRHGKLEGLKPKSRSDAGRPRRIGPDLAETIGSYRARYPFLRMGQLHQMLITSGEMAPGFVSAGAFRNFLKSRGLDQIVEELLATYMGHGYFGHTKIYLTLTDQLLSEAHRRFAARFDRLDWVDHDPELP